MMTPLPLNYDSGLVAAAVTALLIATAPDEFGIPECATTRLLLLGLKAPIDGVSSCLIARECPY